jgi:ribosome-associated protein
MGKPVEKDDKDNAGAGDEPDLRSRSDERRARLAREEALSRLAKDLVSLSDKQLHRLELEESLLDTVLDARAITSPAARNRQIRTVRGVLRAADWWTIRSRLDGSLEYGDPTPGGGSGRESEWVVRLLGEGQEALDELLREHPKGDRGHLRVLMRNVQRAAAARKKKAEQQLAGAIRSLLRS